MVLRVLSSLQFISSNLPAVRENKIHRNFIFKDTVRFMGCISFIEWSYIYILGHCFNGKAMMVDKKIILWRLKIM